MPKATSLIARVKQWLPEGRPLPEDAWRARHRGFVVFLYIQAIALMLFGIVRGYGVLHSVLEGGVVGIAGLAAALPDRSRKFQSVVVTAGLLSASAILVHLSGGTIEAHFHFFVMVILVTLYQSWTPFLLSIVYVFVHHGISGSLDPDSVYNHPAAVRRPFTWAAIHGLFILGASAAALIVWKRNEILRQREQEHLELSRALDAFSSTVAHDLRTPLAAIKGAAHTLGEQLRRNPAEPQKVLTTVGIIERQAMRAASLITALLDYARARGEPSPEQVDFRALVRDAAADIPDIHLVFERAPELVVADPLGLRQALHNLMQNASRYARGPDGIAHVTVSGKESANGWKIAVCDRGPGIPDDAVARIFEPLVQVSEKKQGKDGFGLGLAIVAAVAESHGGRAWYEPRPDGGSTFWIFLPRRPTTQADAAPESNAAPAEVSALAP